MTELPLLRFIPFRRSDIVAMCLSGGRLDEARSQLFCLGKLLELGLARTDGETWEAVAL